MRTPSLLEFRLQKQRLEIRAEFPNEKKANESPLGLWVMAASVQCSAGRDPADTGLSDSTDPG